MQGGQLPQLLGILLRVHPRQQLQQGMIIHLAHLHPLGDATPRPGQPLQGLWPQFAGGETQTLTGSHQREEPGRIRGTDSRVEAGARIRGVSQFRERIHLAVAPIRRRECRLPPIPATAGHPGATAKPSPPPAL